MIHLFYFNKNIKEYMFLKIKDTTFPLILKLFLRIIIHMLFKKFLSYSLLFKMFLWTL